MDLPSSSVVDVHGLDEFAAQLLRHAPSSIGYLAAERILPRNAVEPLGRRQYTRSDLTAYLPEDEDEEGGGAWAEEPERDADGADDDEGFGGDHDDDDSQDSNGAADPTAPTPPHSEQDEALVLTRAVARWIIELAEENVADGEAKLRIKVWSPKGTKMLYSKRLRVVAREPDEPRVDEAEPAPQHLPRPLENDPGPDRAEPASWAALNGAMRGFLRTALGTMETLHAGQTEQSRMDRIAHSAQLRSLRDAFDSSRRAHREDLETMRDAHRATVGHLRGIIASQAEQLKQAHEQIDSLLGETLGFKIDLAELGMGQQRSHEDRKVSADLQKQFMDQAGSLAQLWLASKTGVLFDPELIELMKLVQADDALRAALKNPKLLALLKNPEMRQVVIATLNDAAESFAQATGNAGNPSSTEPS